MVSDQVLLPLAAVCLSVLWQLAFLVPRAFGLKSTTDSLQTNDYWRPLAQDSNWTQKMKAHIRGYGGYTIFLFKVARLVGNMVLLYLTLLTPLLEHCQPVYPLQFCAQALTITFVSDH